MVRITRRSLLGLTVTSVGTVTLAACGAVPVTPAVPSEKAEAAPKPAEKPAAPKGPRTVRVYVEYTSPPFLESAWKPVFAAWEKQYPDIKLDAVLPPGGYTQEGYRTKLITEIAAGNPPDAARIHQVISGDFMANNLLRSVDDLAARDAAEVKLDDFGPSINVFKWRGKLYGLPDNVSLWALWYNTDLFTKYGVKTPTEWAKEGKWTWDQFLQTAKEMTRGEGENKTWGLGGIWSGYSPALGFWGWVYYLPVVWSYGGDIWNKEITAFGLTTREAVAGLQFFADLILKHQVAPPVDKGPQWDPKPGKVAMGYLGHFHTTLFKEAAWKPALVNTPSGRAGAFSPAGLSMVSVMRAAKNEDLGWVWAKWITTEGQKVFLDAGYTAPTRESTSKYPGWAKSRQPWESLDVWNKARQTLRVPVAVPGWTKIITDHWAKRYDQVLAGKLSVQEAVTAAKKAIDAVLKEELKL